MVALLVFGGLWVQLYPKGVSIVSGICTHTGDQCRCPCLSQPTFQTSGGRRVGGAPGCRGSARGEAGEQSGRTSKGQLRMTTHVVRTPPCSFGLPRIRRPSWGTNADIQTCESLATGAGFESTGCKPPCRAEPFAVYVYITCIACRVVFLIAAFHKLPAFYVCALRLNHAWFPAVNLFSRTAFSRFTLKQA